MPLLARLTSDLGPALEAIAEVFKLLWVPVTQDVVEASRSRLDFDLTQTVETSAWREATQMRGMQVTPSLPAG